MVSGGAPSTSTIGETVARTSCACATASVRLPAGTSRMMALAAGRGTTLADADARAPPFSAGGGPRLGPMNPRCAMSPQILTPGHTGASRAEWLLSHGASA